MSTPRQELTITITARFDGFQAELCFSGQLDQMPAITKRIRELGGEPAAQHTAPLASGKPKVSSAVSYADDGTPLCANANCSRHRQPLEPSQHNGYYCKGKDSRTGNAKGYCKSTAE